MKLVRVGSLEAKASGVVPTSGLTAATAPMSSPRVGCTATSTAGFRRLAREISLLMGYELTRDLPLETKERRLAGFLMRKGDSSSIVFAAIRKAKSQE